MKITDQHGNSADYIIDLTDNGKYGIFKDGKQINFGSEQAIFDTICDAQKYLKYVEAVLEDKEYGL